MDKKALIVEDSESMAELERRHLERGGFEAEVAPDGARALELIREGRAYDILVIDYRLPDMSGAELMQKAREAGSDLPSLIVTAAGSEEVAVAVMKLGAMDYIVKDRETIKGLPDTCREVLRRHGLMRENERLTEETRRMNAELSEANTRLIEITRTDDLTGVYNRRYMMELFAIEILRARRYGSPLSFAIFDLDHFKRVNDTHGHRAGDLVLRQFADAISARLRRTDIFGRYGGEEFAMVLTETPLQAAFSLCEELRGLVAGSRFGDAAKIGVTTSAGVASIEGGVDMDGLIDLADRGLYAAKKDGRNRAVALELREK